MYQKGDKSGNLKKKIKRIILTKLYELCRANLLLEEVQGFKQLLLDYMFDTFFKS